MTTRRPPVAWFEKRRKNSVRPMLWKDTPTFTGPNVDPPSHVPSGARLRAADPGASESGVGPSDASRHEGAFPAADASTVARLAAESALSAAMVEVAEAKSELARAKHEADELRASLEGARRELGTFAVTLQRDAERELVKLASSVASRVVARELETAPALIVAWAREALAGSKLGDALSIAVSPDVAERVEGPAWEELQPHVELDATLGPLTCELRDGGSAITVGPDERLGLVMAHVADASDASGTSGQEGG